VDTDLNIKKYKKGGMMSLKIKSIKRCGKADVFDITVKNEPSYILEHGLISHNSGSGLKYSASIIVMLGKKQDKTSTGTHLGKIIPCKINKSRFTREQSRVETGIKFESGLQRYDGLLDLAILGGLWEKGASGKIKIGVDEKGEDIIVTPKAINKEPEKYFDMPMLIKLNQVVKDYFCFGSSKNLEELEEGLDEELVELNDE